MTDDQAVAVVEQPNTPAVIPEGPGALLAIISRIAMQPELRLDVLTLLLDRQERMEAQQAERAFNEAMNACQAEIMPVVRDAENKQTNSRYAKLETVDAAIRPIYTKHGFSLSFNQVEPLVPGNVRIACECAHRGGHAKFYFLEAPHDTLGPKGTPTKTALHGLGSTDTFLRRYLSCNIFNVTLKNLDDDGNRGGARFINGDQAAEIFELLKESGRQEGAFLDQMFAGQVRSIEEIDAGAYLPVTQALRTIIRARQKKENSDG